MRKSVSRELPMTPLLGGFLFSLTTCVALGASCIVEGTLDRGPSARTQSAEVADVVVNPSSIALTAQGTFDARYVFTSVSDGMNLDCREPRGLCVIIR